MIHFKDLKANAKNYTKSFASKEVTVFLKYTQDLILRELSFSYLVECYTIRLPRTDKLFLDILENKLKKLGYTYKLSEGFLTLDLQIKI
jgi:hypothetical protein